MRRLAEVLIMPPTSALLAIVIGLLLRRRYPRVGWSLSILGILWLWTLSTPIVAGALLRTLQPYAALPATGALPPAQAIVILSAESYRGGTEYGEPVAGPMTMWRVRYGARLHKRTGLPVLCAGGRPATGAPSLGEMMQNALQDEFSVPVRWVEDRSADTWQNAEYSAELLQQDNIERVLLVSSAWHLPRAMACFERLGIEAIPAPTGFRGPAFENWQSLLPSWQAMRDSCWALHEWLGRVYYATLR